MPSGSAEAAARFDIVIVGAGPAGSAAALAVRQVASDLDVLLIEAAPAARPRIGEVLPAAGFAILHRLGVAEAVAPACRPAPGLASAWGGDGVVERPALLSARGADQHLDRGRFDHLLAEAASVGVEFRRGAAVTGATPVETGWELALGPEERVRTRFVIWATGRRRAFLRPVGGRQRHFDRLVGYLHYFVEAPGGDPRTLLEAAADGWWYAAALPGGVRGIGFMTDADLGRRLGLTDPAVWRAQLADTALLARGCDPAAEFLRTEVSAAGSSLIEPVCGPGWIAAGDAASMFEPLASHGIAKALRSGCFAAYAAADALAGRGDAALARYAGLIRGEFAAYRTTLAGHYAAERRWADRPFWARRHLAVAA
jgi:flavin-dependent dehydrogenase